VTARVYSFPNKKNVRANRSLSVLERLASGGNNGRGKTGEKRTHARACVIARYRHAAELSDRQSWRRTRARRL